MIRKLGRLFVIRTRLEAMAVIYALGVAAVDRGFAYLDAYPMAGWLFVVACPFAVVMAGARLLELTRRDNGERRRKTDFLPASQQLG